jgi:NADH:ubiquinone oxidoreductase subunit C
MSDYIDRDAYRGIRDMAMGMKERGARLMTVAGRDRGDGNIDLIYLFDEGGRVLDRRFVVEAEQEVDSISDIYAGATNMERENIDLLGMRFKGLGPGLLLVPGKSVEAPLRKRPEGEA